jgi:hypothetical protein
MSNETKKNQIVYYGDTIILRHGKANRITDSMIFHYPPQNDDKQQSSATLRKSNGNDVVEWQILKEPTSDALESSDDDENNKKRDPVSLDSPLVLRDISGGSDSGDGGNNYLYVESEKCNNLYLYSNPKASEKNIFFKLKSITGDDDSSVSATPSTSSSSSNLQYDTKFQIISNVEDLGTVCFLESPSGTVECESGEYDALQFHVGECNDDDDDKNNDGQWFQAQKTNSGDHQRSKAMIILLWVLRGLALLALLVTIYFIYRHISKGTKKELEHPDAVVLPTGLIAHRKPGAPGVREHGTWRSFRHEIEDNNNNNNTNINPSASNIAEPTTIPAATAGKSLPMPLSRNNAATADTTTTTITTKPAVDEENTLSLSTNHSNNFSNSSSNNILNTVGRKSLLLNRFNHDFTSNNNMRSFYSPSTAQLYA